DLERDPERQAEPADRLVAAVDTEEACGLEQLSRLQPAPVEVALDGGLRVVRLPPLERLAAGEAQGRVGEQRDGAAVAGGRQLRERPREEVVAGRACRLRPVRGPGGGPAAAELGAVGQVV